MLVFLSLPAPYLLEFAWIIFWVYLCILSWIFFRHCYLLNRDCLLITFYQGQSYSVVCDLHLGPASALNNVEKEKSIILKRENYSFYNSAPHTLHDILQSLWGRGVGIHLSWVDALSICRLTTLLKNTLVGFWKFPRTECRWRLVGAGMRSSDLLYVAAVWWPSWMTKALIILTGSAASQNSPILWDVYHCIHCCHLAPQTVQFLTDALIQVWKEILQDTINHLIRSKPGGHKEDRQTHGDCTDYPATL